MGTYWDEFLYQFPWVSKLPLADVLELFWHWCGTDNGQKSTVFDDRLESASKAAESASNSGGVAGEQGTANTASNKICPECKSTLVFPRTGTPYCEECGWPDEVRPEHRENVVGP